MEFLDSVYGCKDLYNKTICPDCVFKNVRTPIVGVPFPQKVFAVLVSRDPTIKFIPYYEAARLKSPDDCRSYLMGLNAPPVWIADRIELISKKWCDARFSEESIARLRLLLKDNVYWTHLHKCCTHNDSKSKREGSSKIPAFNPASARICANRWLDKELVEAVEAGALSIICLGGDVETTIRVWRERHPDVNVKIFYLPHPSTANNGIWYSKKEDVHKMVYAQVKALLEEVDRFSNK